MKITITAGFLICVALLAREAVAQTPITVKLLPGETTQSVVAPSVPSFEVLYIASEEYVCNIPTAAKVNDLLLTLARAGRLQQALTMLEGIGTASSVSIGQAFGRLVLDSRSIAPFSSQTITISQKAVGNYGYTHAVKSNCLTVPEARAGINDIRRIIRAYLELPAPTN